MYGKEVESFQTITAMSTNPYAISVNVYLTRHMPCWEHKMQRKKGSWTIVEGKNEKSCVLAILEGWRERVYYHNILENMCPLIS